MMKYEVVLKQYPADEDMPNGYWTAICPSLPCCVTDGETRAEALAMIADAVDLWLVDDEPLDATETLRQKAATLLEAQRGGIAAETHLVEPQAMTNEELTAYPRFANLATAGADSQNRAGLFS